MNLLALFGFVVFAAETVISPIPENTPINYPKPEVNFGQLIDYLPEGAVLGGTDQALPTPSPTPTTMPTRTARKNHFTIAVLGDSMVDTLGPDVGNLASGLKRVYPTVEFTVINHGVGAENIDSGVNRLTNGYTYLGQGRPSVISQNPDVVIVESFGYNPFVEEIESGLNHQWNVLGGIVAALRAHLPQTKIVVASTIAPNSQIFGDGVLNWSQEGKQQKTAEIKRYIENATAFAKSQGLPLADAYHSSLGSDGSGKLTYINEGDHIHYSEAGRALMAQKIAEAIIGYRLLE